MGTHKDLYDELMKKYSGGKDGGGSASQSGRTESAGSGYKQMYDDLMNKYNQDVDDSYINRFIRDTNSFFGKSGDQLDYKTGRGVYDANSSTLDDLGTRGRIISRYLERNADIYENQGELQAGVKSALSDLDKYGGYLKSQQEFFSQFDTEDDFLAWKDYDEKSRFDLKAGQEEIDALERQKSGLLGSARAETLPATTYLTGGSAGTQSMPYGTGRQAPSEHARQAAELDRQIAQKKQYLEQAKRIQERIELTSVSGNDDFREYRGIDPQNTDPTYRWINDRQFRSDAARYGVQSTTPDLPEAVGTQERAAAWLKANGDPNWAQLAAANLDMMSDDERGLYNYHYAKGGAEQANAYLRELASDLNLRKAASEFEKIEGRTGAEILSGIGAGFDQYARGLSGLTSKTTRPTSVAQYKGQMVREDLADNGPKLPEWMGGASLGQMAYDATSTTANMAPSILASTMLSVAGAPGLATWVGSGTMGAGAAGNARQEALAQGYSNAQATTYGLLVGGAEMAMEKILGGISAFGGGGAKRFADKLTGSKLTSVLNSMDSVFLQVAAHIGSSALSEGSEEYVQELLDPVLRNLVLGEDNELALYSPEALYSGLLGALTGGLMEGPTALASGSAAAAEARMHKEDRMATLDAMQADIDDAVARLEALDIENDALASAIAKTLWGQDLNRRERRALQHSEEGRNVLDEMWGQKHYSAEEEVAPAAPADPAAERTETVPVEEAVEADTAAEAAEDPLLEAIEAQEIAEAAMAAEEGAENAHSNPVGEADGIAEGTVAKNATTEPSGISEQLTEEEPASYRQVTGKLTEEAPEAAQAVEASVENVEEFASIPDDSGAEVDAEDAGTSEMSDVATARVRRVRGIAEAFGLPEESVQSMLSGRFDAEKVHDGIRAAWDMGRRGIPLEQASASDRDRMMVLEPMHRRMAHRAGWEVAHGAARDAASLSTERAAGGPVRTIEEVAGEYGNQAKAVSDLYREGQDVEGFASAVRAAWEMGGSGIPMERVNSSPRTQGITAEQRRTAYLLGQGAARVAAQSQDTSNAKKATGGTVRRKGVVKAQSGITISELSQTFNDRQRSAYKLLSFYAEATGIDVVLYKGTQEQETGRFAHGEDTIYIDITAGTNGWDTTDLSAYTMMRTFAHEFVHFVEKWSAEQYNQLREVVFSQMEKNGQDAESLVELAMQEQGLTFDQASREVVAEALTDILPDSKFLKVVAREHKPLFEKIKERLEAFVTELKDHWKKLTGNNSREAVALKTQVGEALGYAEEVLQAFDRAAGEAVEAYQQTVAKKQGRVHAEGIADDLSELQKSSIRALEAVADALDLQIHLYESTADENGIRNAPNGYYDTSTGNIYLDVNAGLDGEGTMLFTAAHELTHFIKQWSPEKFQKLADFLVEKYGEKGISAEELVERQQAKAKRTGRELDYDAAFEEMVADSMEAMLSDGDVVQRLSELKQTDKGLWEKLKEKFAELVQKIRAAYKGLKPDSAEGKYVAEMLDAAEKLKELFAEGLTDAAQNHHPTPAEQSVVDDSDIELSARENGGLDAIEKRYKAQTDYLFLHENRDTVFLDNMVVKEELQGRGIGTKILEDVIAYADAAGKTVALTPTSEFGTKKRLTAWYKKHGFVENKGRNTDFRLRDTMYRLPRADNVKLSARDTAGRELSQEQQEYFQDSKVRDEQGRLMVMYHGTPNGNHTKFRSGTYFTPVQAYADKYQNPNASMLSVKKNADAPKTYEVYLNITKPFDTRNPRERKIFMEEYYRQWGTGAPLADSGLPDWTDGMDLQEFIEEMEYDYDGLILDEGATGGYGMEAQSRGLSYVTFSSEQVKNADNKAPTKNPDIRFSLRQPVEETKTLIAMHNLTEDKLAKAVELGGFPMPSIAVTKADIPHTNFGEITLVMDKDTVDPKADRRNDVFSADAWTPTFPRTEYEVNSEVEDRVRRTLQELERKIAPQFQGNLRRVMYGLEDLLNSYDGEENLIGHVLDNDGMKAVYLESQGKHIDEVQVEQEVPKRFNQAAKDKYEAIIAALGTRDPAEIGTMPLKDIRDNYGTELEKIVPGISKTALRLSRFMQQTIDYLMDDGSGPETEMVVDQNATRRAMEDALDREGYEAWVRELFSGIEGDKGIYNGKERFTPSGRSRSFQQTHLPVTLDNIVKAMAAQNGGNTKNVAGFNGVKTLRAGTAQRFKSIQGMHDLEGRLQNLTEEEQTALTDGLQSRLYDLIDEIDQEAGRKGTSNNLIRFDQIGQIITEASETGRYNVADIQKVFQENHHEISDELAMKVKELLFDVSQMPVNLFEAKPRRAVRFDEVRAAVVPADTSKELKRKLEEQGVPVIEYERDNTDDRMRKVNSVEGVKFSERDPAAQKLNGALEKENAAQAQEIQYLRELVKLQGQVTNGTKFTRSSVRTLAQQLMKDAGAKGNYLELSEKLNGIYESIATQDDPLGMSWDEVEGRIDEAARWLVEHIEVKQDRGEYANDILRDLRGRKISLNAGQRAEVEGRYGSYDTFRKSMFGSVTISKDGTPLDMVWQELSGLYPGTFDADIGDADMALELADVVARLRETDVAAMEFEMQRDGLLEDLRHKVYDGYWKVSTLHTVADKWQKKVDALKQQHQDTMKKLDKARQERDAANADRIDSVKKVREQKNEAVKKVRQQYQESKKKSAEGRKKTEMRHKVQRVVKELNDLLLKPDKKKHVPEGLRKAVAEALDMVNMDYLDAAGKIEAINDELAQLHTKRVIARKAGDTKEAADLLGKIRQLEQRKARLEDQGGRMDEKLEALHTAYEKIKESADPEIANAYDEGLSSYILMKAAMVGDTPLKNMNMEQLGHVYDLYQMVLKTIRDANEAFNEAVTEGIREMADNADREITSNGKRNRLGIKMVEQLRKFGINNLKPTYFFHYLNSRTFRQLYQGLLDGQGQFARNMDEARSFRQDQAKKYGAKNWDREKTWKFKAASGEKFSLNLEQIMSLYAYSKRDQSREHIRRGGIVIDADTEIQEVKEVAGGFKVKLKGKSQDATAYNIDDVTLDEIIGKLTAKQRAYVDAMQDYLSDTMGAKGNEVSLKLYGIKLFKEKHYFPLKSAKEYSARAKEQAEQTARLKNAGFTKATKPHASNPIMLTGFSDVWADHVQDMSSYHAMTLPIEDIYRVYNYSRNGDGVKGARSVVAAIENAFGKQATGYMDQLLKDLNGGQIMDSAGELLEQMTSRFKKGAVFMSASVMIQQSSSVARALAEIDAKYLSPLSYVESLTVIPRQLLGKVNKNASRSHDALWAELKQYAPVAIIKEMGSFDMNMGKSGRDYLNGEEYSGLQEKWQAFWKDGNFRDELLSRGPALADELAWCDIWRAVKREVHDNHPRLEIGSEEFLKLCGARFTEIIDKTQVYDSVLSRSANMRSKNGAMKMATSFMAEPTVGSNMMAAAILEGKRGNAKKARRMAGAVMAGNIINAALAAIVYAARDDDEDEEYWEKYLGHLAGEVADSMNPLTYIPVAQDIVSVFQGWDVERADMAIVSDLYNAWNKLFSDKATTWEKTRDVVGAVSQIFSLPLKNALKDAEALWRVVSDAFDGQESTATGIGYAILAELPEWVPGGGVRNNGDQLYEAILSGDKAHEERVRERFRDKNGDIDEGKVRSALRKAIRENDSRVREAAVYLNEGQLLEYYNIVEEIAGEGFFHKDDVVSAIQSEANAMQEDSGNKETATHHKSAFKAEHFAIAAADGDSQMMNIIKADLILTAQDNGKTETEAEAAAVGTIRGAVKEAFVEEGMLNESQVKKSLMGWCDATEKEASDTLKEWIFEKQNGYPLSELEDVFVGGEITANKAEGFLVSSGGYARTEAQSKVLQWRCEVDTGIRYDDVQQLYVGGKLTADKAKELRVKYGESSIEDARKTVLQWQCEKDNGIKYSDIDVAYLSGDITEKTAIKWLVKYGEKGEEAAALATQAYRWRDQHTEYKDLSDDKIDRYIDYCESAGISIPDFYEARKQVSEISEAGGTVKDNVVRYIRSLPLSRQQKWAMWYAVKTKSWKDNVSF